MAGFIFLILVLSTILHFGETENLVRSLYSDLIIDFFQNKDVWRIILYACWSIEDKVYVSKQLSQNFMTATYPSEIKINKDDLWRMFQAESFKIGIVFDIGCYNDSTDLLKHHEYFNSSYIWLIFPGENFDLSISYLDKLPLRLDTDMTIINSTSNKADTYLKLYDVYNSGKLKGKPLNITFIGDWDKKNQNESWLNFFKTTKIMRRADMKGMTMKVVVFIEHNHENEEIDTYLKRVENPHLDSSCKLSYHLVLLIQDIFNYSIQFVLADNWGGKATNGKFGSDSIMGILSDQKADIAACSLLLADDRLSVAVPVHMPYLYRSGFLYIDNNRGDFANLVFLSPFEYSIWISMALITILIMISVTITMKYGHSSNNVLRLSDFFISIWGIWCQIGTSMPFKSISSRIVFLFLLFNAMIVYNFYTSSILSSLLNYKDKSYTLKDLADSKIKCGSFDETYARSLFLKANNFTIANIDYFNSKQRIENYYETIEEGLDKMRHESFAFFLEYSMGYYYILNYYEPKEICFLQEIDVYTSSGLGIYSPKNSEYENIFRFGLTKLREHGFLDRASRKWIFEKPICQSNVIVDVNIQQVTSYFTILMMGMLASLSILCTEILINHFLNTKRKFSKMLKMRNPFYKIEN